MSESTPSDAPLRVNPMAAAAIGVDASMLLAFKEAILQDARNHDQSIVEVTANENWQRLKTLYCIANETDWGS